MLSFSYQIYLCTFLYVHSYRNVYSVYRLLLVILMYQFMFVFYILLQVMRQASKQQCIFLFSPALHKILLKKYICQFSSTNFNFWWKSFLTVQSYHGRLFVEKIFWVYLVNLSKRYLTLQILFCPLVGIHDMLIVYDFKMRKYQFTNKLKKIFTLICL